ncbi:MAG: S-adenosylmethionine:tRNA ribosyltransferase-isomerase [Verrucomicrobia subdivision 3 bacterium]|nr:S-adenosylmethionine:tRNA ribosyltransferase-isomerase [Limisphaerales bacterium]MCS1412375.1 S-adenosylmethionine:tRNA ribosyltransferase-isomerase [Limisphaerales bacterium]
MNLTTKTLDLSQFDYALPEHLIAQKPTDVRDESRLLILDRAEKAIEHRSFADLATLLKPSDVLVVNDSKVIPARLRGKKCSSEGAVEILLLEAVAQNLWWVMLKPGKRVSPGTTVQIIGPDNSAAPIQFEVKEKNPEGHYLVSFNGIENILDALDTFGEVPLPPYIEPAKNRSFDDINRYQTIYARHQGSVAAPTAGLHFSEGLLQHLEQSGISIVKVILHVGLGTFTPVKTNPISEHQMHKESFELSREAAKSLAAAKAQGRRIIAVGTTTVRVLETVTTTSNGIIQPQRGKTNIFIYPPYEFKIVDALITNFHLPKSSLLMLVSAFASPKQMNGIEMIHQTYAAAIKENYRFFSYGDAMFIQ